MFSAFKRFPPVRALVRLWLPALVFGALCPQVVHFSHHNEPDRVTWNLDLPGWPTLEKFELSLLDRRFSTRGNVTPPSRDRIAIVAIDDPTLSAQNQWPFPRSWHARLIERLHRAGARVIGLDLGFDSYQGTPPTSTNPRLSQDDQALADAMKRAGNVVLVSYLERFRKDAGATSANKLALRTPVEELDTLTPDLGVVWVAPDSDDSVRRVPLWIQKPPDVDPIGGLAPMCAGLYQGLVQGQDLSRYHATLRSGFWPDTRGVLHALPQQEVAFFVGKRKEPEMRATTTALWFWGAQGTFPTYSYSDVLNVWSNAQLHEHFAGRIVLVGATARILKDIFPLPPFEPRKPSDTASANEVSGVEINASTIAMLLDGQFLGEQDLAGALWTLALCTFGGSLWTWALSRPVSRVARRASTWWLRRGGRKRVDELVWLALYAPLLLLPVLAFWQVCQWAFSAYHLWIWATFPLLGLSVSSLGTFVGLLSAERSRTHSHMARILAPDVLEEILRHPEAQSPRPRRAQTSVLFCDLDGFTAYAEAREPEEVVEALNAFFSRMHPIIAQHGGSIDKYMGDSIMAFFGAPLPRPDHAAQALRCAIALQDECERFRHDTGILFWMRIGVHSGTVLVGSIGAQQQLSYTVIGDAVNLASRLEGKNKEFGSRILCSAQTHEAAPGVALAERAETFIRGKTGEIKVFIVRGPAGEPPRDTGWSPPAGTFNGTPTRAELLTRSTDFGHSGVKVSPR